MCAWGHEDWIILFLSVRGCMSTCVYICIYRYILMLMVLKMMISLWFYPQNDIKCSKSFKKISSAYPYVHTCYIVLFTSIRVSARVFLMVCDRIISLQNIGPQRLIPICNKIMIYQIITHTDTIFSSLNVSN